MKSYKKKSIVAGSPAAKEHEEMMVQVNAVEPVVTETATSAPENPMVSSTQQYVGVFSQQMNAEPMKNVQTRIPLSVYEKLNRMKYFAGQRTSIGDILSRAITEFVDRHPVQ